MINLVEIIMQNYIWIIIISIIILLAVIGYYADKTNFGQGKENNENEPNVKNITFIDRPINESIDANKDKKNQELNKQSNKENSQKSIKKENRSNEDASLNLNSASALNTHKNDDSKEAITDDDFEKFSKEFDSILPKKDLIDEDLLSDIENLSLDKTQKINLKDIPDLDNIELPKIKPLKSHSSKKDIWSKN